MRKATPCRVPQQETLLETFAQSGVDQKSLTSYKDVDSFEQPSEPVLASTPVGQTSNQNKELQMSNSDIKQSSRSRHQSENLSLLKSGSGPGSEVSSLFSGSIYNSQRSVSDSFPPELAQSKPPPSTNTSHDHIPRSVTSFSDWSSTMGEMQQYQENAQRRGSDSAMSLGQNTPGTQVQNHFNDKQQADTPLFAVGPLAHSEEVSIPPTFTAENQVSYDHRFDSIAGRERRANSVIPSEYVLINEQLHRVKKFHVSNTMQSEYDSHCDYRRSFTPPASVPLSREPSLKKPTPAAATLQRVTSPLSEHNKFISNPQLTDSYCTDQSIKHSSELSSSVTQEQDLVQPLPIAAPISHTNTPEAQVKHGWPDREGTDSKVTATPVSSLPHTEYQLEGGKSAFSALLGSEFRGRKGSDVTLTNSVSPPFSSPTPPSKGARGFEDTIEEDDTLDLVLKSVAPSKPSKRPSSAGSKISKLKKPLLRTRSKGTRELSWSVKRNQMNKAIYGHKENKIIECAKKLELDVGQGLGSSLNPKLTLLLHPYGLEIDKRRNVTLEVRIDMSKKAPRLNSTAKVRFSTSVTDTGEDKKLNEVTVEKDVLLREFYIHEFISHEALRDSRSETIEIKACADYFVPGSVS